MQPISKPPRIYFSLSSSLWESTPVSYLLMSSALPYLVNDKINSIPQRDRPHHLLVSVLTRSYTPDWLAAPFGDSHLSIWSCLANNRSLACLYVFPAYLPIEFINYYTNLYV